MAQHFTITAHNAHGTSERLQEMGHRATQIKPIFNDLIHALIEGEKVLWSRDGGSRGKRWEKDTKRTIARKIAHGQDPRTMRATGRTERALTERGAEGQIATGGGTTLTFGVKGVGANVAQYSKGARHREVLRLLPSTRKEIRQIILDHILEGSTHE